MPSVDLIFTRKPIIKEVSLEENVSNLVGLYWLADVLHICSMLFSPQDRIIYVNNFDGLHFNLTQFSDSVCESILNNDSVHECFSVRL